MTMRRRAVAVLGLLIAAAVNAPPAVGRVGDAVADTGPTVRVISLNLYLGLDVGSIFAAPDAQAFQAAAAAGWANVRATDFHERADALARLIDEADADVVGLQEAVLWKTGPLFDPAPADHVAYDFIAILVESLAARGLDFAVVGSVENLAFEAPVVGAGVDVGVIDRDALLVRIRPGSQTLKVLRHDSMNFAARLAFPFLGSTLAVPRGWVAADVKHRGQIVRIVTTHLEALAPPVRDAQAAELLSGAFAGDGPGILLADLNAAADGSAPGTYGRLASAGFIDAWIAAEGQALGATCCHDPTLTGPGGLSERIDYVLLHEAQTTEMTSANAEVFGDEEGDRTGTGLWPSDHGGVVAELRIMGTD